MTTAAIRMGDGHVVHSCWDCEVEVPMGSRTIAHRFYVMDTEAFDFVLGTDFFVQHSQIQSLTLQAPYLLGFRVPVGGRPRDAAGNAQVSRQAKHYAHRGINALMSCDKAFQNPCHSVKREQKYVQQHIRICTHGVKTGLG